MKKIIIILLMIFVLIEVVSAEMIVCDYEGNIKRYDKSKFYKCPSVLVERYELTDERVNTPSSGGGGIGGGYGVLKGGALNTIEEQIDIHKVPIVDILACMVILAIILAIIIKVYWKK